MTTTTNIGKTVLQCMNEIEAVAIPFALSTKSAQLVATVAQRIE